MAERFADAHYPAKVWAAVASAAFFAVSTGASLWLFFGQADPLTHRPTAAPSAAAAPGFIR